ncbi:MAG: hypothetical protein K2X32_14545 [Phycisphaerales bacterium]|nr:hypothetical protein [Phycisphaerales bacterium]
MNAAPTINLDALFARVGRRMTPEARQILGLIFVAADDAKLRQALAMMPNETVTAYAAAFDLLSRGNFDGRLAPLAERVSVIAAAANDLRSSRGLGFFDPLSIIGGISGAIGSIGGSVGSVLNVLQSGPLAGVIGSILGNEPNLPQHDYNASNAQAAAAAAARQLLFAEQQQAATRAQGSASGDGGSLPGWVVPAAIAGVGFIILTRRKSR